MGGRLRFTLTTIMGRLGGSRLATAVKIVPAMLDAKSRKTRRSNAQAYVPELAQTHGHKPPRCGLDHLLVVCIVIERAVGHQAVRFSPPHQPPKRRLRCWNARIARRKSTLRNAGQLTSVKYSSL